MLVALPGQNGGPMAFPTSYMQLVSKHLWDLGARPSEAPTLKYRRPVVGDPHWATNPGIWVPVDAPDDDPRSAARRAADSLIPMQKAEMFRELAKDLTPRQRYDMLRETEGPGEGSDR